MKYLLAVEAPAFETGPGRFAIESAFAEHLRSLLGHLSPRFGSITVVAPSLGPNNYEARRHQLAELSSQKDKITFLPTHSLDATTAEVWRSMPCTWRRLKQAVREADFVHSGLSVDIKRPFLAMLNLATWQLRKPSLFVVDIDFRQNSQRYYRLGDWGLRSYLSNVCLHDRFRSAQVALAARTSGCILLKSASMVEDFGAGRPNVKFFLDAAHSDGLLIDPLDLEAKLDTSNGRPLRVIYFGRLVRYKGLDYAIRAIGEARQHGCDIRMTLIGDGDDKDQLVALSSKLNLEQVITFSPGVPYGSDLFAVVDSADIAIASPRVEDTPRAALDAMARGIPIVAFDIEYFKSLASLSGAVALAEWPSPNSLAAQLIELGRDRVRLAAMSRNALDFAQKNTQDIWLTRRIAWTMEVLECGPNRRLTESRSGQREPEAKPE